MEDDSSSIAGSGEVVCMRACASSPIHSCNPGPSQYIEHMNIFLYLQHDLCAHLTSELSHDDLLTQDTGIDMSFYPGSPLIREDPGLNRYTRTHMCTHAHTHTHHTCTVTFSSTCCRNQEGRNSFQRAVDRSSFSELTSSSNGCHTTRGDHHVGDPSCMAGECHC